MVRGFVNIKTQERVIKGERTNPDPDVRSYIIVEQGQCFQKWVPTGLKIVVGT